MENLKLREEARRRLEENADQYYHLASIRKPMS
jgi:hypothetical protein